MPYMSPSPEILQAARTAYASGNLIIFGGAGVSTAAGLPSWLALAKEARDRLQREGKSGEDVAEVNELIERRQLIDALSAAKRLLGDHEFNLMIEVACDDRYIATIPDIAMAIAELAPKLKAIITTNLDCLLERALAGTWPPVCTPTGDLAQRRQYILKLHGTLFERHTWVFTRDQYDKATFGQPQHRAVLEALFRGYQMLFVGFGLADDDFDLTLSATRALAGPNPPVHFALVKQPILPYRREQLEKSGIRILAYEDHCEVPGILRALRLTSSPSAVAVSVRSSIEASSAAGAVSPNEQPGLATANGPDAGAERLQPPVLVSLVGLGATAQTDKQLWAKLTKKLTPAGITPGNTPNEKKARYGLRVVWAGALALTVLIGTFALMRPPQVNSWLQEEESDLLQAEVLQDGQEVWATVSGSLLHSTDGARTWSKEEELLCPARGFWLVRAHSQPRVVCSGDVGIIEYYDSGFENGRVLLDGRIRNIAMSPDGLTAWAAREGMSNKGKTPIEIHKTTDRGESWTLISSLSDWKLWDHRITVRQDGRRLFGYPPVPRMKPGAAAAGQAILVSDNDGRDWHPVLQAESLAINRIASSSYTVCAVGRQVYRSKDGGDTWQQVPGVPPTTLWDVQSVNNGDYWAAGDDGVLLRSTDCQAWTSIPTDSHASFRTVRIMEGGNKVFLFGDNKTLRVSIDAGKTWQDPLLKGPPSWYYPVVVACLVLALWGLYVGGRRRTSA